MDLGITDKVALVAASSRGLGRAVAAELAAEGAHLVMCARSDDVLQKSRAEIVASTGAPAVAIAADLSDQAGVERVVAAGIDAYGHIDILVTNAGGPPPGPFESHSPDTWRSAMRQNFESVVNLSRAVLPGMKQRKWGRIINITSIAAKQPVDNLILSNSMRAAVAGFARTLANEMAPHGITVNSVLPGYTRTQRLETLAEAIAKNNGSSTEDVFAQWAANVPMGRIGTPEEFAAMVAFLASTRASYITGTSILVDGGCCKSLM